MRYKGSEFLYLFNNENTGMNISVSMCGSLASLGDKIVLAATAAREKAFSLKVVRW